MDFRQGFIPQAACLLTTCALATLAAVSLVYLGSDTPPEHDPPALDSLGGVSEGEASGGPAKLSSVSSSGQTPVRYTMKNHGGKLAVFEAKEDSPRLVFDVYINTLPEYDQQLLQEGVTVEGEDALTQLIEDYIS